MAPPPNRVAAERFAHIVLLGFQRRSGVLVMAATDHAPPDRERAETSLRLQPEAELRRALTMPKYKPPREPMPGLFVQSHRMRQRRAVVRRLMRQQVADGSTASSQTGHASQTRVARSIAALPVIRR